MVAYHSPLYTDANFWRSNLESDPDPDDATRRVSTCRDLWEREPINVEYQTVGASAGYQPVNVEAGDKPGAPKLFFCERTRPSSSTR